MKLIDYVKSQGAVSASKVVGPNGAFISCTKEDKTVFTLPVGKKSQNGKLEEYNAFEAPDTKQIIATVNEYENVETIQL